MFGLFATKPPDIETVDLSSKRSIVIRDQSDNRIVADYFYHAGEYWTAVIPLGYVTAVCGQSFNFSKVKTRRGPNGPEVALDSHGLTKRRFSFINHLLSRFHIAPEHAIELYPFGTEVASLSQESPVHTVSDFIYSVEATGQPGVAFDFRNGMKGTLICTHRFLSTEEMVFERVVIQGHDVLESPALPLAKEELQEVLLRSLVRSDEAGLKETYYLYRCCGTNNCTSNPFRIIDEVASYSLLQHLGAMLYRLPLNPRLYLWVRGLDSDPDMFKLVRSDFEEFIADPKTQSRKTKVVRETLEAQQNLY